MITLAYVRDNQLACGDRGAGGWVGGRGEGGWSGVHSSFVHRD